MEHMLFIIQYAIKKSIIGVFDDLCISFALSLHAISSRVNSLKLLSYRYLGTVCGIVDFLY